MLEICLISGRIDAFVTPMTHYDSTMARLLICRNLLLCKTLSNAAKRR